MKRRFWFGLSTGATTGIVFALLTGELRWVGVGALFGAAIALAITDGTTCENLGQPAEQGWPPT